MSVSEHFAPFRFCPHCGSQEVETPAYNIFACRACDFRYYTNAASATIALIRNPKGEILFVRRGKDPGKGKWDLPGGFVDPGEGVETALLREIAEEVAVEITSYRFLTSFPNRYPYRGVLYHTADMVFLCETPATESSVDRDEITESQFMAADALDADAIAFESVKNALRYYRESL